MKVVFKNKDLNILPLTVGGDHLCSLPILRSLSKNEPVGWIQFDSHTDLFHSYFDGQMYTHRTHLEEPLEENLIDPKRTVQVGIRELTMIARIEILQKVKVSES